jgi:hypothetical protein
MVQGPIWEYMEDPKPINMRTLSKGEIIKTFLYALLISSILIHLDYRFLFKFFKKMRAFFNRTTGRPIVTIYWDERTGLPHVDYSSSLGVEIGKRFNPLIASQVLLEEVLLKDTSRFIELSRRMLNLIPEDGLYRYDFPIPSYTLEPGFISAFTQAAMGETFARAWKISGDTTFLKMAKKTLKYLRITVNRGGVTLIKDERIWFLEYVSFGNPPPMVLNGMLFTLIHLKNIWEILGDTLYLNLYKQGEITVRDSLENYDLKGWSFYDRLGTPSSELYHMIHVDLMKRFYDMTGSEVYRSMKNRWIIGFHYPHRARIAWGWFTVHILLIWFLLIFIKKWKFSREITRTPKIF